MKFYRGDVLRARLAAWLDVGRAALRVAAPVVDLLIRLFLAKAFFMPGMFPGSSVADFRSAWPIIIAQIMGPVLLAVGFWVRPVALLMLVLTLLAQASGAPQDEHLFWAALFGWYVVRGAGTLSLDHVLQKGLGRSALPLAGPAMAAAAWVNREIGPLYLLGLRLWLGRTRRTGAGTCNAADHGSQDAASALGGNRRGAVGVGSGHTGRSRRPPRGGIRPGDGGPG